MGDHTKSVTSTVPVTVLPSGHDTSTRRMRASDLESSTKNKRLQAVIEKKQRAQKLFHLHDWELRAAVLCKQPQLTE